MKLEKGSVLVVADGPEKAGAIASSLKTAGWSVQVVSSPEEGLAAAGRRTLDVLVFCGKEEKPKHAEIEKAARTRNPELEVVRAASDELGEGKVPPASLLRCMSLKEELRHTNRRLDSLLNALFNGVIVVDMASEAVAFANGAAASLLGYEEGEMNGISARQLIPEGQREKARKMREQILKGHNVRAGSLLLRRKDGEVFPCRFNAALVGKSPRRAIQIVFESMSERKRLLQQLSELGEALSMGQALSGIVHEFNNPLAAIVGYAQLSLTTTSRKKLDEYLQIIHQQAGRCQAITQKLSMFARRREPQKRVTDLNKIIREVASLFEHELSSESIRMNLNICSSPLPVRVDPEQMQQVFGSLITNAKEAMTETTNGALTIVSQRSGREAVVTVSDNGPGIAEEVQKKIFQPFITTKPDGTGLGLSISQAILHGSGGQIEVVEKGDRGATFRIELPLAGDAATHDSAAVEESQEESAGDRMILVTDDKKPVASLLRQILRRAGEKVDVALTPTQSPKTIQGKNYNMIQVDIEVPGESRQKIARGIKPTNPKTPEKVVFCRGELLDEETSCFLSGLGNSAAGKACRVSRVYAVSRNVQ